MGGRRVLVIGSQCRNRGNLSFLPKVAERLHALLIDPGPGECLGAEAGDPPGLFLDPTVNQARDAIKAVFDAAARDRETLILVYIGHGEFVRDDFFLMPTDAASPPDPDGAIHLASIIRHRPAHPGGLMVLLDTCHSGAGAWDASEYWVRSLEGRLPFEVLTATDDQPTARAWFTQSLIRLLERGDPTAPDQLRCEDARNRVRRDCPQLNPQLSTHNPGGHLRLGRNSSKVPGDVFWKDSPGRVQILEQTEYYQPTAGLDELVAASQAHRIVIATGATGVGKSTLAAAMARPEITDGRVPPGFAQAVAMLNSNTNLRNLAVDLRDQLRHSMAGFAGAVEAFHRSVPLDERQRLDPLSEMVLRPLDHLDGRPVVRIVLDGLDQFPNGTRPQLRAVLDASPDHLRLVITARDNTPDVPVGSIVPVSGTDRVVLGHYLEERGIRDPARAAVLDRARDHWLLVQLLADAVLADPTIDLSRLPVTVNQAYATRLDQAGAADGWSTCFRPVLGPLAVAGAGPVLPLALLEHASTALGGPSDVAGIVKILDALRGLVVRRDPGTPDEHAGVFHPTLAEYLLGPEAVDHGYAIDAGAAHRALAVAIADLAPASDHKADDSLHRYAFLREADHWWASREFDQAVKSLSERSSNSPRENLDRWLPWHARISDERGRDYPHTLTTRHNIAYWTGKTGAAGEALRLFQDLLPDMERVLGRDHPHTLTTRNNIAYWTGETGAAWEALGLFQDLLPDQERVLGRDHPHTLTTRHNIASLTGETGGAWEALGLCQDLLPDRERVLGRDHPDTLTTRNNIAHSTGETGGAWEALGLCQDLLPDRERVLGRDHPDTLTTRNNIAHSTGETGGAWEALGLCQDLLPDRERVLGCDHPHALNTLGFIGIYTIQSGDLARGCQSLREGWARAESRFGAEDPTTRAFLARIQEFGCGEPGADAPINPGPR